MAKINPDFINTVKKSERFNATACMNCGVCASVCPMGLDFLPRQLFRYAILGVEEKVIQESETIYSCLLCKMCEVNCPSDVHIAENLRFLKYYINKNVFAI